MKINILAALAFALSLVSCISNKKTDSEKEILTVSIEPQKYFLEQLVGDKYTINCAIPSGANPETFDPTPSQLVAISKSKAYFTIGTLSSEKIFIEKIKKYNDSINLIDCSQNIQLLGGEHHYCDSHSDHEGGDPHIWSTPETARIIVQNMYYAMIAIDEDNEGEYRANYRRLLSEINQTDEQIKTYLSNAPNKNFIIYHPALTYFAEEYRLHQFTIEHDGKSPSPTHLAKLVDTAKEENIKVVFIQQEFDAKNAETLAKEIGAKTYTINLLNYNWSDELINIAKALGNE